MSTDKAPGSWLDWRQLAVCGGVFALVLGLAYAIAIGGKVEESEMAEAEEAKLIENFKDKRKVAINLGGLKARLGELEATQAQAPLRLPSRIKDQYIEVMQAARDKGLSIDQLQIAESETPKEFYAELPATLKVSGTFRDIGAFVAAVTTLRGATALNDVKLEADPAGHLITLESTLRTYRLLDDAEIAAQRKAARAKGAKK